MPKFTKKPVEVEARQFDGTQGSAKAVCAWMAAYGCEALRAFCGHDEPYQVYISTLEGRMTASAGDWIIRGVKGEFYPCKPDIFAETYEPSALSHAAGQDGEQCRAASELPSRLDLAKMELAVTSALFHYDAGDSIGERLKQTADLLRALSRGVPEGMVLVPAEPTQAMLDAFCELEPDKITEFHYYGGLTGYDHFTTEEGAKLVWSTMLAAIAAQRKDG